MKRDMAAVDFFKCIEVESHRNEEKVTTDDIIIQVTQKQSRLINKITGKRKNMYFGVNYPALKIFKEILGFKSILKSIYNIYS